MRILAKAAFCSFLLVSGGCVPADEPREPGASVDSSRAASPPAQAFEPRHFEYHGEGIFGGERIGYRLIAGDTLIDGSDGRPGAALFTFTYLREDVRDRRSRPVVFIFNGGPGSSSIWMHMGLFGPRRIAMDDPLNPPVTPPFALEDNPYSILDAADLVLIDPAETGFSQILPGGEAADFLGTQADAVATARFIEQWLITHDRWESPKYLVGASYGTTRAALTARILAGGPMSPGARMTGIGVDGIVLVGQAIMSPQGPEAGQAASLGAMAASAWYHGKAGEGESRTDFIADAEAFAVERYLPALFLGDALDTADRAEIAASLARFTGLPADLIEAENLRPSAQLFRERLLNGEGLHLGAYDARYTLPANGLPAMPDPVGDDPAMAQYSPSYVAGLRQYLAETGIDVSGTYTAISFSVNSGWDRTIRPPSSGAADSLAGLMRANRDLRVMVVTGEMDLVTHIGSADYFVRHAGLQPDRIVSRRYPSGHMPYLGDDSAESLSEDLRAFVTGH
ncbi:peptidase S10, serine carboxypeptidase [Glycocaulis alkaliphilus]|uniref:Peptidase S10, serine carboxypeptidase n=1 Tax=Glycocaulis alkaliphilus TaxID=1434191 RepID=A0A3T0EBW0_9PROT|nr:peptidase S10 [Glycocaulis alkaliphilus]AZU04696.1 peptidase S10, serine carboxypeptidase [Glycocaulis alkaliphilus]GGB68451.1 peptidase S10 [Glycocaulis alkaliphilus]